MTEDLDSRAQRSPDVEIPEYLPLLPIRDLVVFPYMIVPLRVSRPMSMEAVGAALEADERLCFLVAQKNPADDDPEASALYRVGTVGMILPPPWNLIAGGVVGNLATLGAAWVRAGKTQPKSNGVTP